MNIFNDFSVQFLPQQHRLWCSVRQQLFSSLSLSKETLRRHRFLLFIHIISEKMAILKSNAGLKTNMLTSAGAKPSRTVRLPSHVDFLQS